jgi:hypothetical protein
MVHTVFSSSLMWVVFAVDLKALQSKRRQTIQNEACILYVCNCPLDKNCFEKILTNFWRRVPVVTSLLAELWVERSNPARVYIGARFRFYFKKCKRHKITYWNVALAECTCAKRFCSNEKNVNEMKQNLPQDFLWDHAIEILFLWTMSRKAFLKSALTTEKFDQMDWSIWLC